MQNNWWTLAIKLSIKSHTLPDSEEALTRCFLKKVFWKYAAYLQENTHAEVWLQ